MRNHVVQNQNGMTLMELMLATAMSIFAVFIGYSVMMAIGKGATASNLQGSTGSIELDVNMLLRNPLACTELMTPVLAANATLLRTFQKANSSYNISTRPLALNPFVYSDNEATSIFYKSSISEFFNAATPLSSRRTMIVDNKTKIRYGDIAVNREFLDSFVLIDVLPSVNFVGAGGIYDFSLAPAEVEKSIDSASSASEVNLNRFFKAKLHIELTADKQVKEAIQNLFFILDPTGNLRTCSSASLSDQISQIELCRSFGPNYQAVMDTRNTAVLTDDVIRCMAPRYGTNSTTNYMVPTEYVPVQAAFCDFGESKSQASAEFCTGKALVGGTVE